MILNNNYSKEVLMAIDNMPIKEKFIKLELLDWQENPIKEIQGVLTGGNINIDGKSTVRRTCSLNFIVSDQIKVEEYIKLNSKFNLFIGLKNRLQKEYKTEVPDDIIWFKQGVFVFANASFSKNATQTSISVTAKDKMCLLNGDIAGTIPDTTVFHQVLLEDEDGGLYYEPILIFDIIQELVHHYGGEKLSNIYISDIPEKIRALMSYKGNRPVYMLVEEKDGQEIINGNYTFDQPETGRYVKIEAGDQIGYILQDFIFTGELISQPGEKVTTILDKIKSMLGNFEYFYDIDGNFHFQEIRNYLNNSFQPIKAVSDPINLSLKNYQANFDMEEIIYSFKDNPKLISSYNNNPNYENIKNDFVVWGVRKTQTGIELPIRYHLAIDGKPEKSKDLDSDEWRERLYQYCQIGKEAQDMDEEGLDYYTKEMLAEWEKLYSDGAWNPIVESDPTALDYFIDFIDENSEYGKYSVNQIGRRTYSEVNNSCTCVFNKEIPDVIFVKTREEQDELKATGEYEYVSLASESFFDLLTVSSSVFSCYDRIRELIYQNITLNETINITALPIYWLEVNRKIEVEDDDARIYGQYMINSISIPLSYNGTMSIQATRALSRI